MTQTSPAHYGLLHAAAGGPRLAYHLPGGFLLVLMCLHLSNGPGQNYGVIKQVPR